MKSELLDLRAGKISFDTFAKATAKEWDRMGHKLYRAYRNNLPLGVEVGDIIQEMMLAAWKCALDWDPARGGDFTRYVTWSAYAIAKRWVNGQRNALKRADKAPSRFPIGESMFATESGFQLAADREPVEDSEVAADAKRIFSRVICTLDDPHQVVALRAWEVMGSADAAIELLQSNPTVARSLNIWTPADARRLVSTAIDAATRTAAAIA